MYMDPYAQVSTQVMTLALNVDTVELMVVMLMQPTSPAHDEFAPNKVVVLIGAGMQPAPLMY